MRKQRRQRGGFQAMSIRAPMLSGPQGGLVSIRAVPRMTGGNPYRYILKGHQFFFHPGQALVTRDRF